jgi:hypothetical protein
VTGRERGGGEHSPASHPRPRRHPAPGSGPGVTSRHVHQVPGVVGLGGVRDDVVCNIGGRERERERGRERERERVTEMGTRGRGTARAARPRVSMCTR